MPFKKGHKINKGSHRGGRKGFEFEVKQYKEMLRMTDLYFALLKKILKGKPTTEERMRFEDVRQAMGKIIDKLHANKEAPKEIDIKSDGEKIGIPLIGVNLAILDYEKLRRLIEKEDNTDRGMQR